MLAQKKALIRLFQDDDPETVSLVKEQLIAAGGENILDLQELMQMDSESVSRHAREVFTVLDSHAAEEEFLLLCHFFGDGIDMEYAYWTLARALDPGVDIHFPASQINRWGNQFLTYISGARNHRERVLCLSDFLFGQLAFRGSSDSYYCEKSSLLPHVINARMGIPITLTWIAMMIGARAGMKIEGINLPGHFIARHGEVYFDPFHQGRILTHMDIEAILLRQGLEWDKKHLCVATRRQMLLRMLANLFYVYDLHDKGEKREHVRYWMQALRCSAS